MRFLSISRNSIPLLLVTTLAACGTVEDSAPQDRAIAQVSAAAASKPSHDHAATQTPTVPAQDLPATPVTGALPLVVVHKLATCDCCIKWVEHLRQAGFTVDVRVEEDVTPIKDRVGVPVDKRSCHTAEVGGYFIEGHVPAEDIKRLLADKPDAKGLTVPGMPAGSPGMEMPDGKTETYMTSLVGRDGSTRVYAQHGQGPLAATVMVHDDKHEHAEE